jgi:hypothetical protein
VEAIRATTAEDPFFPSINIGSTNVKETFINAGPRIASPVKAILEEATSIFPGRCVSCLVSIGSGVQGVTGLETTSTTELVRVLKDVMNDSERVSEEVAKELSDKDVFYCRLNVDYGLQGIGFEDWEKLGDVKTHTGKYLEKYDVTHKVSRLVQVLNRRAGAFYCHDYITTPINDIIVAVIASTIKETLVVLANFLEDLTFMLPGESWSTVISKFIRRAEVFPMFVLRFTLLITK